MLMMFGMRSCVLDRVLNSERNVKIRVTGSYGLEGARPKLKSRSPEAPTDLAMPLRPLSETLTCILFINRRAFMGLKPATSGSGKIKPAAICGN